MKKTPQLEQQDIEVGVWYAGKRRDTYNRLVIWISPSRTQVQYDSDAVKDGRPYPRVSMEQFLSWAGNALQEEAEL